MLHFNHPGYQPVRAAVLRTPGNKLCFEQLQLEPPRHEEVLVQIVATGVCHTDVHLWEHGGPGPVILGHESAGIIQSVGKSVRNVQPGDHVILTYQSCGNCRNCEIEQPAQCTYFWELNFAFARMDGSNAFGETAARGHFFGQSSFASHALTTERNLIKVDKTIPLHLLAPLGSDIQTGAGTILSTLPVQPGSSVAIFGADTVGLAAVMAAKIVGAEPIIATDLNPQRLALARELGATHTIASNQPGTIAKTIASITGNGVDHLLEITGEPGLYEAACRIVNPNGHLALLRGTHVPKHLRGGRHALHLTQSHSVPQHFVPHLIDLYQDGKFPFDRLVRFYQFDTINQALHDVQRGNTLKPVLLIA
jgi:aryl-alcohol dehydrogenase